MASQRPKKWYAVGFAPVTLGVGVYPSWAAAKPFCIDPSTDKPFVGCRFKGFTDVLEAAKFVEEELTKAELHDGKVRKAKVQEYKEGVSVTVAAADPSEALRGKRQREEDASGSGGSEAEKKRRTDAGDGTLHVYTDGSCFNNGKKGAKAGFGVYYGAGDSRNVGQPLEGPLQTNQRAELTAIKTALEATKEIKGKLVVHSDSMYSMQCITEWSRNWRKNGWLTAKKEDVKNRDLIEPIDGMLRGRAGAVEFKWVKGHRGDVGNEQADRLAREGTARNRCG